MEPYYRKIIEVYKHFAWETYKPDNVYMSYGDGMKFLNALGVFDEHNFKKVDYDCIFKAVNYTEFTSSLNPLNGVVRYEFLETIIRVAIEKYKVQGTWTKLEAIQKFMTEVVDP